MSDVYQVDLEPLGKDNFFLQVWVVNISLLTSHFCFHFFHSAQPKDTPQRVRVFTQIPTLRHGLKRDSTKVPIQNAYLSFYMPLLYCSNFPIFVINLQHQPFIKSILIKDVLLAIEQSLVQRKSDITITNHNKSNLPSFETNDERTKATTLLSNFPFYSAFHRPILQTSIQCCSFFNHPQFDAN